MGLAEYFGVMRQRWRSIAISAGAATLLALIATLLVTPQYQASSQVYVSVRQGDSINELVAGRTYSADQVASYAELALSPKVLQPVIDELGLADSAESLSQRVSAEMPESTVLITIMVTDESPEMAARIANATAGSLSELVPELEKSSRPEASPVELSTVREAVQPAAPISPRPALNTALGLLLGLIAGFGIAVLRDLLDTKIRNQGDVQKLTASSIIGTITFDEEATDHPLIVQESPHAPRAEAFRRLRTNLQFLEVAGGPGIFVITSAVPGEGKSTTSINLAITLADAGSRVLLVDADLRRPSVSHYLGLEGSVGLTTVLIGRVEHEDAIQSWGASNLHVLPSGQVPPNPSELLGSQTMAALLAELGDAYDVVIVDTAPLLPVTDGAILAKMTGGAVVVVGAGILHRPQLTEALGTLDTVGAKVLGVVVNRLAPAERAGQGYGGYYSYGPVDSGRDKKRAQTNDDIPRHGRSKDAVRSSGHPSGATAVAANRDGGAGPANDSAKPDPALGDTAPKGTPVVVGTRTSTPQHPFDPVHKDGQAGTNA